MPIEIRELIIKTTVEKRNTRTETQPAALTARNSRKEILDSCRKMVKKIMKETKER